MSYASGQTDRHTDTFIATFRSLLSYLHYLIIHPCVLAFSVVHFTLGSVLEVEKLLVWNPSSLLPLLPSLPSPRFIPSFSFPYLLSPYRPLSSEVPRPLIQLEGLGERCQLPQRVRAEPGRQMDFGAFSADNLASHYCKNCLFYGRNHLELD